MDKQGQQVFIRRCRVAACDYVFEGTRAEAYRIEICPRCHATLEAPRPKRREVDSVDAADWFPSDGVASVGENERGKTHLPISAPSIVELVPRDFNARIELPRADDEGVIGRSATGGEVLSEFPTISRMQFSYRYLEDGRIEIRNLSRFGTTINGERLETDPATGKRGVAIVSVPAVFYMGGIAFDLREVAHGNV